MVVVEVCGQSYAINKHIKKNWDKIKDGKLAKMDEDRIYVVDGRERSGKSTFTFQQAAYIDPTIITDYKERVTYSAQQTLDAIRNTRSDNKHTKVIIWDEAFRGLSSSSGLSKENKTVVQCLMEMGQHNLVLFIVSPSFFLLNKYSAMMRSNTLFHIIKNKSGRRYYRVFNFNQKALLYNIGLKRGWSYNVPTKFKDGFSGKFPGGDKFKNNYEAWKNKCTMQDTKEEVKENKYKPQRDLAITALNKALNGNKKATARALIEVNYDITDAGVGKILRKVSEIADKTQTQTANIIY